VATRSRRVAAVLLTLGIIAGLWRPCAGWAATAEARMSCCDRMAMCPMRKPVRDASAPGVSQDDADACCAAADRTETTPTSITVIAAPPVVPVLALFAEPPAVVAVTMADWHGPPPLLASRQLQRHLLLSVFLI
jgi:hypothetical protein